MSYQPDPINEDSVLARYLATELQKVSDNFRSPDVESINYKVWHVAPDKPRAGRAYYADGINWNPGSGEGLYIYLSTGAWSKL